MDEEVLIEEEESVGVGNRADVVVYWLDCAGYMIEVTKAGKGDEHSNIVYIYRNVEIIDMDADEEDLYVTFRTSDGKVYRAWMGLWACSLKRIYPDEKVIFGGRERIRPREW